MTEPNSAGRDAPITDRTQPDDSLASMLEEFRGKANALKRMLSAVTGPTTPTPEARVDLVALEFLASLVFNQFAHVSVAIQEQARLASFTGSTTGQAVDWYAGRALYTDAIFGLNALLSQLAHLGEQIRATIDADEAAGE